MAEEQEQIESTDATFVDASSSARAEKHTSPYEDNPRDRPPGQTPTADSADSSHVGMGGDYDDMQYNLDNDAWLLAKAEELYSNSTAYIDTNIANTWEVNLSHFRSEHSSDSAYCTKNWKRSKIFRPKTRSVVKTQEAAMATAAFATQELVNVEAVNPLDQAQLASAAINKNILQYRLDRTVPWFLTVMGAWQDTKVYGLCISHQYWDYQIRETIEPAFDQWGVPIYNELGERMGRPKQELISDQLRVDDVAPENFRFDAMCDWRDPIGTSPFLIYMTSIPAGEVLERMRQVGPDGKPLWQQHELAAITATRRDDFDRTRQAREGDSRIDPMDNPRPSENTPVWIHMNIIKVDGDDYVYWTLGTQLLLTYPKQLTEQFPHLRRGERPFTLGYSTIEAHRNYPAGDVEQMSQLQRENNTIANNRIDNVKLVLNKRYYVRRGSQVDLDALIRNVPGGGVMMNDPDKDVKTVETNDVTGSSYQEQHQINTEIDELVGTFGQGDAQTRRNPGETAMGIAEISGSASAIRDYGIRIFMETWMEPTLRQCMRLIQYYETDETIIALAADQAQLYQKFGIEQITDELLRQELTVRVNLGIGNTDPVRRVERLVYAISRTAEVPGMAERMKGSHIGDEIFGSLGYKNASRFFDTDEEFEKKMAEQPQEPPLELQLKQLELQIRQEDNQARNQREQMKIEMEREINFARIALERDIKLQDLYARLGIEEMKDQTARDSAALRESNKMAEMSIKRATGSGI